MAKNEKTAQMVVHTGQQPTEEQIKEIEAAMACRQRRMKMLLN